MKFLEYFSIFFLVTRNFNESTGKTFNCECEIVEVLAKVIKIDAIYKHLCAIDDRKLTNDTRKKNFYGIYRFGSEWWCDKTRRGGLCNTSCENFLDDDITDDALCAEKVLHYNKLKGWKKNEEICLTQYQKVVDDCLIKVQNTSLKIVQDFKKLNDENSTVKNVSVAESANFERIKRRKNPMCNTKCLKDPLNVVALIIFIIFLLLALVVCCKCRQIIE